MNTTDYSKLSHKDLIALATAQAGQIETLAAQKARGVKITPKVAPRSGGLSVHGGRQYPLFTLYLSEFDRLAEAWPAIVEFVAAHREEFAKTPEESKARMLAYDKANPAK